MGFLKRLINKLKPKPTIRKVVVPVKSVPVIEDNSKLEEFKKSLANLKVVPAIDGKSKVDVNAIDKQLGIGRVRRPVK
jgi:hypothetical protein